jgi:hypothetical protein
MHLPQPPRVSTEVCLKVGHKIRRFMATTGKYQDFCEQCGLSREEILKTEIYELRMVSEKL